MLEDLAERVNGDANLVRRGKSVNTTFLIAIDNTDHLVSVRDGRITGIKTRPVHHAELCVRAARLARSHGRSCGRPKPVPGFTDIFALVKKKLLRIEGDLHPFMTHLLYFKGVREPRAEEAPDEPALRAGSAATCTSTCSAGRIGSTSRKPAAESRCSACTPRAPTAGSIAACSTIQRITARFRVIAFDMPWHGKSSPPAGWEDEEYRLTSRDYVGIDPRSSAALELDKPVVMGCSIGGRIVLHLAHEHPRDDSAQ